MTCHKCNEKIPPFYEVDGIFYVTRVLARFEANGDVYCLCSKCEVEE